MNYTRPSYLPTASQDDTYNVQSWPHNTLRSYAPEARASYARGGYRQSSYAPRVPTLVRQDMGSVEVSDQHAANSNGALAAA